MKITVFGLGYVGVVSSACFADKGHEVIGVDPVEEKVKAINDGKAPILEPGLAELISRTVGIKKLSATTDSHEGMVGSDILLVTVGTPSKSNGQIEVKYIEKVCLQIGEYLSTNDSYVVVVIRSTIAPGTMDEIVLRTLERVSGKKAGKNFGVCNNPEFLREGSAIHDFNNPPKTVIGEYDERAGTVVASLYEHLDAPIIRTKPCIAEFVKYVDNAYHGLKVAFANEVGDISKKLGIDGREVMRIFCKDHKLNISEYYFKPGAPFGGSCLPKDLRALNYTTKELEMNLPIIGNILSSNAVHLQGILEFIRKNNSRRIGLIGLTFKQDTDDLRESPFLEMAHILISEGYEVSIFDRNLKSEFLIGSNKTYLESKLPRLTELLQDDLKTVVNSSEIVIIAHIQKDDAISIGRLVDGSSVIILDLVNIQEYIPQTCNYTGICW